MLNFATRKRQRQMQNVIISDNIIGELQHALSSSKHDVLFVLTDTNTEKLCLPLLAGISHMKNAKHIVIGASDVNKNIETIAKVWTELGAGGGTRHSLMINLGGGMVTDLGGFAASTFKRGISFINIPTTLLAMVDASVGGKTGINFNGLKNEIGVFNSADYVILDTEFIKTLDAENIRSGYAEMLKHGLISTAEHWNELIGFDLENPDIATLRNMVGTSVEVKEKIVEEDPLEKGIRKALNLGHTIGHAFESLAMESGKPVLHGYAVAWGLVCELYLACIKCQFPTEKMRQTVRFITDHYGKMPVSCDNYERLYEYMTHDKKNIAGHVNFTLLADIGKIRIDQSASKSEIFEALDFFRDGQ